MHVVARDKLGADMILGSTTINCSSSVKKTRCTKREEIDIGKVVSGGFNSLSDCSSRI